MFVRGSTVLLCLLAMASSARAAASLEAVGPGELREVSHEISIRIDGTIAEVETAAVLANAGATEAEALYGFELPANAAVTGLELRLADGTVTRSAAVDARAATRLVVEPELIDGAADAGLLRLVVADPDSELRRYELRAAPIPPGKSIEVRMRYAAPLAYRDGRLSLRLPGRGDVPALVREEVTLTLRGPHRSIYGGGALLASQSRGGTLRFTAPVAGDLIVEAVPGWRGGPRAEVAIVPISSEFGVAAVSVVAPLEAAPRAVAPRRVLLVVDVSRSIADEGLAAARTVAEGVLHAAGGGAKVELITFDRDARRLFGRWRDSDRSAARDIARALGPGQRRNGSNPAAALELAATALAEGRPGESLVLVITDGVLPLGFGSEDALDALGDAAKTATVATAVLVPDAAPVPDRDGALAALAHRSGGRVVALHHREVAGRAAGLLAELAEPAPLENLEIVATGAELSGLDLPGELRQGSAALALGIYRGKAPARLSVKASRAGRPIELRARKASRARSQSLARLAVAASAPGDWASGVSGVSASSDRAQPVRHRLGRQRQLTAATRLRVVSQESALVAVDAQDGFGRERLELARRFGSASFRRMPPEPERAPGHVFRAFALHDAQRDRDDRRTGELDAAIVRRLLTQYLLPRARACYDRELRSDQDAAGALVVELELARGEVHHARVVRASLGIESIADCVVEAGYVIDVPTVAQGDDPEAVTVVRYPLRFHRRGVEAIVPASRPAAGPDADDPLGGIPPSAP